MRVAADFFPLRKVFLDTDFIILLHSYCIQVRLCYNIVLLFDSHYIRFRPHPSVIRVGPNKLKFLIEMLHALEIGKDRYMMTPIF